MIAQHIEAIDRLVERIGRPVKMMEVCGTHTMAAFRTGLRSVLPDGAVLISGPGCPVCVTPDAYIDTAIALALQKGVEIGTFGDMIRVPGTESSLQRARADGGLVKVVYSPTDALAEAKAHPDKQVVFLGVGFETTAPTVAWTIRKAREDGVHNYSVLGSNKTIPIPMAVLADSPDLAVDGFLCPGHVSTIIGSRPYEFLAREKGIPCVIAGFEAEDMLAGIEMLLRQKAEGRAEVEIQYKSTVRPEGNPAALRAIAEVFEPADAEWRGLGVIPGSGLGIRAEYADHDAGRRFAGLALPAPAPKKGCLCASVLRGAKTPLDCRLFGKVCTPETPRGPCMVSSEGTCAAWFKYARHGIIKTRA